MGHNAYALRSSIYTLMRVGRDRCCQYQSPLDQTESQTAASKSRKEDHTLKGLEWCADLDCTGPQTVFWVADQRHPISEALARPIETRGKGMFPACVIPVHLHASPNFPMNSVDGKSRLAISRRAYAIV